MPGHPAHTLFGPEPGQIDFEQPFRILKDSRSKLTFASYHPPTALAQRETEELSALSISDEEIPHPRRIVIETNSSGQSFWRFVPTAKKEDGYSCDHEGGFPRDVDICGCIWMLDQDQWDVYKLDPYYECIIRGDGKSAIKVVTEGRPLFGSPREDCPPSATEKQVPKPRFSSAFRDQPLSEMPQNVSPSSAKGNKAFDGLFKSQFTFTFNNVKSGQSSGSPRDNHSSGTQERPTSADFFESPLVSTFESKQSSENPWGDSSPATKEVPASEEFFKPTPISTCEIRPLSENPWDDSSPSSVFTYDSKPLFENPWDDGSSGAKDRQASNEFSEPRSTFTFKSKRPDAKAKKKRAHEGFSEPRPVFTFGSGPSAGNPQDGRSSGVKENRASEGPFKSDFRFTFECRPPSESSRNSEPSTSGQRRAPEPQSTFGFGNRGAFLDSRDGSHSGTEEPASRSPFGNSQSSGRAFSDDKETNKASESYHSYKQAHSCAPASNPFLRFGSRNQSEPTDDAGRTPPTPGPSSATSPQPDTSGGQGEIDKEAAHRARIEESRRKMAELEKDRHLWDSARKMREIKEREEQAALEKRKKQRLEEERAKREANEREIERERQLKREEEIRKAATAAQAKRETESRRRLDRNKWSAGPWSSSRALERYKELSEQFDRETFSLSANPLFPDRVPWPVLRPHELVPKDIDWSHVEAFFKQAKRAMSAGDYTVFLDKALKRFHPDRWRSRSLFGAVPREEVDSGTLEATVIIVAQAVTPIWKANRQ